MYNKMIYIIHIAHYSFLVDTKIPFHIEACGQYLFLTLCQVLMICFFYPWFTIAFVIIIACVIVLDWTMQNGVKETKRLDNQLKVSMISIINDNIQGKIAGTCHSPHNFLNVWNYHNQRVPEGGSFQETVRERN